MIKRDLLLRCLKEMLDKEEKCIPLYAMQLSNTLFLSDAKPEDQEKVRQVLFRLKTDSERHKVIYNTLIAQIEAECKDVY